ncbi:hypothetical protein B9Z65_3251 [Elsinoe australis]|uniref:Methyltransferase domain-containing protein n=1 Tax=Elsinoe australis TaxID=40998 RepID=A0A2P7ZUV1_9PEZI|nr:hypothetical protein B9Z65_3251 [Elsinoe australis]
MIASSRPNFLPILAGLATFLFLLTVITRSTQPDTWPIRNLSKSTSTHSSQSVQLRERLDHAEELWKQSVQDRKLMTAESGKREFPDGYIYPYNLWDFTRPTFFCPYEIERVGSIGDGGKWVCGMSHYQRMAPGPSRSTNPAPEMIMYSFGVNDDSSFEARMMERTNTLIWGYDYSVNGWAGDISENQSTRAKFMKAAIGKQTTTESSPPYYSVQDLMKMNGHDYVDIVKMDIEGAEFDALTSLVNHVEASWNSTEEPVLPFGQLLVEIHIMTGSLPFGMPVTMHGFLDWWSALERLGLRPVFNEHNWIGDVVAKHPRYIEYTFINARHPKNKLLFEKMGP